MYSVFDQYRNERIAAINELKMWVIPSGYPIQKLDEMNKNQIMKEIQSGLFSSRFSKVTCCRIEKGMLKLTFSDETTAKIARERISKLVYRLGNESTQHPLIMTHFSTLSIILMSCKVSRNIFWDSFLKSLASQNGLSSSLWLFYNTADVEDEKQKIYFFVDPETYLEIHKKGHILKYNGEEIEIQELHNIFKPDMDDFRRTDTSKIMFHWYVNIKDGSVSLPTINCEYIKELTIHNLPFDFYGGPVLNYIFEKMNLEKFNFGAIPLILNGEKQELRELEASEIQVQSTFEMFRQFPCKFFFLMFINA